MSKSDNEKGYALLIVLFMIVFILSISAIFMRGSISNAMQEHRIDESHLTVMTAEAGVDYTKQLLINEYFERTEELDILANEKKNEKMNYAAIHKEVRDKLDGYLKTRIGQEKYITDYVEFTKPYNYKLITYSFSGSVNPREIIFSGTIEGKRDNKESKVLTKRINFKQSFLIPDYSTTSNSGGTLVSPSNLLKIYPDNITAPACPGDKLDSKTCKGSQYGGYKNVKNSKVYFPNGFKVTNGNFQVYNSVFFSKETFEVANMNDIEKSTLNLYKNLIINSNVKVVQESTILALGNADFKGQLTVSGNSLVCVGSLSVGKNLTIGMGSKVVYMGDFSKGKKGAGELIKVNSVNELWEKCKLGSNNKLVWPKPTLEDVSYE
ncbi:hypothetical protein M3193_04990 [Sporosarcina luteola]|uniref:hypothetical protein n=1 Tax=Sporosarcina luteola TaxID=582850 RepID=UPI00203D1483|nr:hypothetical protein [Sporosarcina luteola]MCM3743488.1 hypothetical protein [Sporosarcina luteola]